MQTRVLVAMLIYSSATAVESPPKTALQLERKQNRAKTLLHTSSSRAAAFADRNRYFHSVETAFVKETVSLRNSPVSSPTRLKQR
jgi:hypothetical protein